MYNYFTNCRYSELSSRMSQYKNYLGKKYGKKITDDELLYAAKNYIADTGYNNSMNLLNNWILSMSPSERKMLLDWSNNSRNVLQYAIPIGISATLGGAALSSGGNNSEPMQD